MSQAIRLSQPKSWSQDELNNIVIDAIQDIKGKRIMKLDLRKIGDTPTDFFIICEGDSNTQVKAISDNVSKRLKDDLGVFPSNVEGAGTSNWICLDYFNTVVHVFYRETRAFYELEDLWGDAEFTEYDTL